MPNPARDPDDPVNALIGKVLFGWIDWLPKAVQPSALVVSLALLLTACVYLALPK